MMALHSYNFLVLRYVHDRGAGEALNVGVLIFSRDARFLDAEIEHRYERLSNAFAGFHGDHYRLALTRFRTALSEIKERWAERALIAPPDQVSDVLRGLWPDQDTSFQWTEPLAGVAGDLQEELHFLFDRMVSGQYTRGEESPRHDDEYIWRHVYQQKLGHVAAALRPKRFATPQLEIEFAHALKNGAWHVVQPVSFDFKNAETMQRKATQWLGTSVGLKSAPDLARIYFLLGRPSHGDHKRAYDRAKALLAQAPIKHELIEEEDAPQLARELESLVKRHSHK